LFEAAIDARARAKFPPPSTDILCLRILLEALLFLSSALVSLYRAFLSFVFCRSEGEEDDPVRRKRLREEERMCGWVVVMGSVKEETDLKRRGKRRKKMVVRSRFIERDRFGCARV